MRIPCILGSQTNLIGRKQVTPFQVEGHLIKIDCSIASFVYHYSARGIHYCLCVDDRNNWSTI